MVDASTGKRGCRLGTADESVQINPLAQMVGRTFGLYATTNQSEDTYVVDLNTCGSMQPAADRLDLDEFPVWGF
jgi:hypothetical protein